MEYPIKSWIILSPETDMIASSIVKHWDMGWIYTCKTIQWRRANNGNNPVLLRKTKKDSENNTERLTQEQVEECFH